jgi:hypothetical protein
MKKRLAALVVAMSLLSLACSGQDAAKTDIKEPKQVGRSLPKDFSARTPDKLTVWQNVDGHPTIVQLCIDGLGWRTISTAHNPGYPGAAARVPEWDAECAALSGK